MIFGIDLGTTFSSIAFGAEDGDGKTVQVIADSDGRDLVPSVVCWNDDGMFVGTEAERRAVFKAKHVVFDSKRLIGHKLVEPIKAMRDSLGWPFRLRRNSAKKIRIVIKGKQELIKPYEVSGEILKHLWIMAKEHVANPTNKCVITVPANFSCKQRTDTLKAAEYAGLDVVRLINEPTAAAIAYSVMNMSGAEKKIVLVFDFGGGYLDVSLIEINGRDFILKATSGDPYLGGRDIDTALVEFLLEREKITDIRYDVMKMSRLKKAVVAAKIALSESNEVFVCVDDLFGEGPFECELTRDDMERACTHIFANILDPVQDVLQMGDVTREQVDEILLVGGSSKIPKVKEIVEDFFGKRSCQDVDPEHAVVHGAAMLASLEGKRKVSTPFVIRDICPFTISLSRDGVEMDPIFLKGSPYGSSITRSYTTLWTSMIFDLYERQRTFAKFNIHLGHFCVSEIAYSQRACDRSVTVKCTLDMNGVVRIEFDYVRTLDPLDWLQLDTREELIGTESGERYIYRYVFLQKLAHLRELHNKVASFMERILDESRSMDESMKKFTVIELYMCRRIRDKARERASNRTEADVRNRDLKSWKAKYRRKLQGYFDQCPEFLSD